MSHDAKEGLKVVGGALIVFLLLWFLAAVAFGAPR